MPHVPEIDQSVYSMVLLITNVVAAQDATPEVTSRYVDPTQLADEGGQFVDVDGASVYYIERGDPENPAVLLLHGFLGSVVDWTNVIDVLAEAGYHVIAFDRPPFANSRADALRALAQALAGAGYIVHALRIYVFETLESFIGFLVQAGKTSHDADRIGVDGFYNHILAAALKIIAWELPRWNNIAEILDESPGSD